MRQINLLGLELIKKFEGCVLSAYPDPASELGKKCQELKLKITNYIKVPEYYKLKPDPWTIGYGHTGPDVKGGLVWSQDQADRALLKDLASFEEQVTRLCPIDLTDNQFSALVSFCYNLGQRNLIKLVNRKFPITHDSIAEGILLYDKAGGQVLPGLTKRRKAEFDLFNL